MTTSLHRNYVDQEPEAVLTHGRKTVVLVEQLMERLSLIFRCLSVLQLQQNPQPKLWEVLRLECPGELPHLRCRRKKKVHH